MATTTIIITIIIVIIVVITVISGGGGNVGSYSDTAIIFQLNVSTAFLLYVVCL